MVRMMPLALVVLCADAGLRAAPPPPPPVALNAEPARGESVAALREWQASRRHEAWTAATNGAWSTTRSLSRGRVARLVALRPSGVPLFLAPQNKLAAISTAAHAVRATAPYDVSGSGVVIGLWDGGLPLASHDELIGRVTVGDGTTAVEWHASHVAGTLVASGVWTDTRGMAPAATLRVCDFDYDTTEMSAVAATAPGQGATRIYLSNHSYGYIAGWDTDGITWFWYGTWGNAEDEVFGQYDSETRTWDSIASAAPYYLIVKSAGNDRSDGPPASGESFYYYSRNRWRSIAYNPASHPGGDGLIHGGYDTLPGPSCAKNILTVGAVGDAVSGTTRWLGGALMESYSGWGPTDDGRIKPDVVGNGSSLVSCYTEDNSSYASASGTSMASPNICGSAALLVNLYAQRVAGGALRAATLKGLILHTADDLGLPGPDYAFGWGLMNTQAAADLMLAHLAGGTPCWLGESTLAATNAVRTFEFATSNTLPLRATLCWSDPPGTATTLLNSPASRLVHDLDLRLMLPDGSRRFPFAPNPATPTVAAGTNDNVRDNVEQLQMPAPATGALCRLRLSYKGALTTASQSASVTLSGARYLREVPATLPEAIDRLDGITGSGGSVAWSYRDDVAHDGFDAARAGTITHGQTSWVETTIPGPATLSFWWRVSSEAGADWGTVTLDGQERARISGEREWAQQAVVVGAGLHTVRWSYSKNAATSAGQDTFWVDQATLAPPPSGASLLIVL